MKIPKRKLEIIMAKMEMSTSDIIQRGMPRPTLDRIKATESAKPETVGKLAKILGCDVTDLLED